MQSTRRLFNDKEGYYPKSEVSSHEKKEAVDNKHMQIQSTVLKEKHNNKLLETGDDLRKLFKKFTFIMKKDEIEVYGERPTD